MSEENAEMPEQETVETSPSSTPPLLRKCPHDGTELVSAADRNVLYCSSCGTIYTQEALAKIA